MNLKILKEQRYSIPIPDWAVCKHLTPDYIVDAFCRFILETVNGSISDINELSIADIFCGDCRLGQSLTKIIHETNKLINVTYVDVHDPVSLRCSRNEIRSRFLVMDVFRWQPDALFDLIIANPPYLRLNKLKAESLGFDWTTSKQYSANLYTLGIMQAISICKDDGFVCVIAPYSWLTNTSDMGFKKFVEDHSSSITISAFKHRGIFFDVHQDIAFQCFHISKQNHSKPKVSFIYQGTSDESISIDRKVPYEYDIRQLVKSISIGSIVWNRELYKLSSNKMGSIPLIHGKNIIKSNGIVLNNFASLIDKQYVKDIYKLSVKIYYSPIIVIRRVMSGVPGDWVVHAAYYDRESPVCAENHVIVIQLIEFIEDPLRVISWIQSSIANYYFCSGSPNISVSAVKAIVLG